MRVLKIGETLSTATKLSLALAVGYLVTKGALFINGNQTSRQTYGGWKVLEIEDDTFTQSNEHVSQ